MSGKHAGVSGVCLLFAIFCLLFTSSALATRYVWTNSPSPGSPYNTWNSAAHTIQDAVDAANPGEYIIVTNGVYDTGGAATPGGVRFNRVCVNKFVFIMGLGDRADNVIDGGSAVRCLYMSQGVMNNFTLTNGDANAGPHDTLDKSGGGAFLKSATLNNCDIVGNEARIGGCGVYGGSLNNCTIRENTASAGGTTGGGAMGSTLKNCTVYNNHATDGAGTYDCNVEFCDILDNTCPGGSGGGVYGGIAEGCLIASNSASYGGGARAATLKNCLITKNSAYDGGGVYGGGVESCTIVSNSASHYGDGTYEGTFRNSIIYHNDSVNKYLGSFEFSCTTPLPVGNGNITNDPLFVSMPKEDFSLSASSLCVDAGSNSSWMVDSTDLDGHPRIMGPVVDMGCYEQGSLYTNESPAHYVDPDGDNIWPFTNWTTAAHIIQDAVDAANTGDTVMVAAGVYDVGGGADPESGSNPVDYHYSRVLVFRDILIMSQSGPDVTIIDGSGDRRCVYMENGRLDGFTVTNGYALRGAGAGVFALNAEVTNCVISGNEGTGVDQDGGGVRHGTFYNCQIRGNWAISYGGGAYQSYLIDCIIADNVTHSSGGGTYYCNLTRCTVTSNETDFHGGGAANSTITDSVLEDNIAGGAGGGAIASSLTNCIVRGNSAGNQGGLSSGNAVNCLIVSNYATCYGGTRFSKLENCTVTGNSDIDNCGGVAGSDIAMATAVHCIVYGNISVHGPDNHIWVAFESSCTTPFTNGPGNIADAPLFVDEAGGDYHLQYTSPCVNAGTNQAWMTGAVDLDENPRIMSGTVDMGCYEYQLPLAELGMGKSVNNPNLTEEATIAFTLTLTNHGPDSATGVEVTDELPAGVSYASHSGGTYDSVSDIWSVGSIANAAVTSLVINATIDGGTVAQTITNAASITAANEGDVDTANDSASCTLLIANRNPSAYDDASTTPEDVAVIVNVVTNDADSDLGQSLTVTNVTQGENGSVGINGGSINVTYTPNTNWSGVDSFVYWITDSFGGSDSGMVTVSVTPANDPPQAVDDFMVTPEDIAGVFSVLTNDVDIDGGDVFSITDVTQGTNGTVVIDVGDTSVTYTSPTNWYGHDTFTYVVSDSWAELDTGTVFVTVTSVNDPPAPGDDEAEVAEDMEVVINVLTNDTDLDPEGSLVITGVTQGAHGTVVINAGGGC